MAKRILINLGRCIYCRACEVACEHVHGRSRIRVFEYAEIMAIPLNCRHCEKAPCIEVCPTRALYKDDDGAVVLQPLKCIGCMMCAIVCPFGVPELDESNKIMAKCDLCKSRRERGELPACVTVCPADALVYGDVEELMVEKKKLVVEKVVTSLREGTVPPFLASMGFVGKSR